MEACWAGGRGREERRWTLRVFVSEVVGRGEEDWRQVFVRWIFVSSDEEGGTYGSGAKSASSSL